MRKIIVIITLLLTYFTQAQIVTIQFDVKNALVGSEVNPPAPDILIKYLDIQNAFEIGFMGEFFPEIKYYSYGMLTNYRAIDYTDINILSTHNREGVIGVIGIEVTRIGRYYGRVAEFFSVGGNAEVRYYFGAIGVTATYNYKYRTDQAYWNADSRWVESVFFGLTYNFKYE